MKIGIDARFLTHPQKGGFKTYTENLVRALAKVDTENHYVLYLDRAPDRQDQVPVQENFEYRIVPTTLPFLGLLWREQVGLSRQLAKDRVDLFHSPCLTAPLFLDCPLVITVHDMIWAFPEKFSSNGSLSIKRKAMEWYNYWIPKYAIRNASAIITVSHAARESILKHLDFPSDRIFITLEAARPVFTQLMDMQRLEELRKKYALSSRFILAIGSADPRKNISNLVHAYSILPDELKQEFQLAIVWTHPHLTGGIWRRVQELELRTRIRFLQQVSDEDLALLYNVSSLFVFPSHYEGFGLPLLEAMACGVPVIAANNSSIPEIAGNAALLFDDQNVHEISTAMQQVLVNDSFRISMREKGIVRAASFSWEKCAHETLAVYNSVLGMPQLQQQG